MNTMQSLHRGILVLAIAAALASTPAFSQDTTSTQDTTNRKDQPEGSQRARSTDAIDLDAVVVTGTSGTRTRMQESVSTSVIGIESIQNSDRKSTRLNSSH